MALMSNLRQAISTIIPSKFSLEDLKGFPYSEYQDQLVEYEEQENWYTGDALRETISGKEGRPADLYPMQINPIRATVAKHAYALFGEVENDGRPLIVTKMIPPESGGDKDIETWKKDTQHVEEVLNQVWWESGGRDLMIRNAYVSQIYGGCFFKVTFVPWESSQYGGTRSIPIRIEAPNPKTVVAIPDASDYYHLAKCWIVRQIDENEAESYGYKITDESEYWYTEYWTPKDYIIRVNNQIVRKVVAGKEILLSGENPFGFVPVVYIPHIRDINFLGSNAFKHLIAYVKELNLRHGDYGDATNDDAHPIVAIRDVSGTVQMKKITNWLEVADLGQTSGITGNEKPPDMFEVRQQRASAAMKGLIDSIWQQYLRDSFVPPVAYGEDEGSQRSAMTLAMRFWPLGSHVSTERYYWTVGMDILQNILLRIMFTKKIGGITEKHLAMRMKQVWSPLLPRDREADVQEWVQRSTAEIASIEHLLELSGDVEDITEERNRILKWIADVEEARLKAANKQAEKQLKMQMEANEQREENAMESEKKSVDVSEEEKPFARRAKQEPGDER